MRCQMVAKKLGCSPWIVVHAVPLRLCRQAYSGSGRKRGNENVTDRQTAVASADPFVGSFLQRAMRLTADDVWVMADGSSSRQKRKRRTRKHLP